MSNVIAEAVQRLQARVQEGADVPGVVKFVLTGQGAIMLDGAGARAGDEAADVTLTATPEVFQAILAGDLSPMTAFMTGRLKVDGQMGLAMKLGSILA